MPSTTRFDANERTAWAGRADAYAATFGRLCAHTVPELLDAAGVFGAGTRLLDVGTGPGTVAAAAHARGAEVTAVDAEPSMVQLARRAVPSARIELAALPELPFPDAEFDAVVANFVLNHVGRPLLALAELRRVLRPGGRLAVTIWSGTPGPGQTLIPQALQAAGAVRPPHLGPLDPADDFPRTPDGLAALLTAAGLQDAACRTLSWDHRTTAEDWWAGPASGVATIGLTLLAQTPETRNEARRHYDRLATTFRTPNGTLALPHTALLATATR
ncbi:class I SAM-dependent methyltransferase [Kitasatospora sp. CB01950]|uniref:class I SAM-dependent methyltransferase n=1 Tax=Kitasatospora sp. CB01950 TaxID=1703930 RepID=UPI00093FB8DD|nr:class I SAM-dependent methyltransferase [Kitasatospora sp. CB01950]OKJ15588.1 methyltransferase type 11 [Kitasatospora sp. CB01950]